MPQPQVEIPESTQPPRRKPLVTIQNHRTPVVEPPAWIKESKGSLQYFESSCGDQWVARIEKDRLLVTCDDHNWAAWEIIPSRYKEFLDADRYLFQAEFGLVVGKDEEVWLRAIIFSANLAFGS